MTYAEEKFLQYVRRGYFSIDQQGVIWRHRIHRRGSKKHLTWLKLDTPRRADTTCGEYLAVALSLNGRVRHVLAHRAVRLVLDGEIDDKMFVNHMNGDKHDNRPENLEVVTPSENSIHARDVLGVGPWKKGGRIS
jgi:hypothetical protein